MNVTLLFISGFAVLVLNQCTMNRGVGDVVAFSRTVVPRNFLPKSKTNSQYPVQHHRRVSSQCQLCATRADSPSTSAENRNRLLARQYVQAGMESFRNGDVTKSIEYFDAAEQNDPSITPYLWQRGLSYYYNHQYEKASQQFRVDVSVNPYDVEEIVWDIASQLQFIRSQNQDQKMDAIIPLPNQLSLPPGSKDRRRIMGYVYKLFRGEGTEQDLVRAGSSKDASPSDEFYAFFYLALYNEAFHRPSVAALYLQQALRTIYGQKSNDYMVTCAKLQYKHYT